MTKKRRTKPVRSTASEPMSRPGTLWQRALDMKDPELGCEVGRLHFAGRMTATEVQAAAHVAEIYGRYEHMAGVKRSCRSPSYEVGHRGGEQIEGANDARAGEAWHELQDQIPQIPIGLRTWLEQLVVEDRHIGFDALDDVRELLRHLAKFFGSGARKAGPKRRGADPKSVPPTKFRSSTIERDAMRDTLRAVDPNLSEDEILEWTTFYFACCDKKRFQAEKAISKR